MAVVVTASVSTVLVVGFESRGARAARNLLVPGAGLYSSSLVLGAVFTLLFVAAVVLWLRWGADWAVAAVVVASIAASLVVDPEVSSVAVGSLRVVTASHEFPLVVVALGLWQWCRCLPALRRFRRRPRVHLGGLADIARLGPVDRCRAISVLSLAGPLAAGLVTSTVELPDVERRARRVALVARARRGPTALDRDHAALRTARIAAGERNGVDVLLADANRQAAGVPASEPGWVRLLDGTMAAAVLADAGHSGPAEQWSTMLDRELGLRRGRRPARYWTPFGVAMSRAEDWEHALAIGIAHTLGWIGAEDWQSLRPKVLGAAARGAEFPADERLISAGRLWLTVINDAEAERILSRVTVRRDPLACAVDQFAQTRRAGRAERGVHA